MWHRTHIFIPLQLCTCVSFHVTVIILYFLHSHKCRSTTQWALSSHSKPMSSMNFRSMHVTKIFQDKKYRRNLSLLLCNCSLNPVERQAERETFPLWFGLHLVHQQVSIFLSVTELSVSIYWKELIEPASKGFFSYVEGSKNNRGIFITFTDQ